MCDIFYSLTAVAKFVSLKINVCCRMCCVVASVCVSLEDIPSSCVSEVTF